MSKHTIDIQINVEGQKNRVILDGNDLAKSHVRFLMLRFDGEWSFITAPDVPGETDPVMPRSNGAKDIMKRNETSKLKQFVEIDSDYISHEPRENSKGI